MKQYLFIIILIVLSVSGYAQKIRFTDSSNVWLFHVEGEPGDWSNYVVTYAHHDDTTIHGHLYRRMNFNPISWSFVPSAACTVNYVREDTVAGIVYRILDDGFPVPDTNERVLYNYNWHVGDTMNTASGAFGPVWLIIDSMGSININGVAHKIWYFYLRDSGVSQSFNDYENYIIEGIGCTGGIDYEQFRYTTFEYQSRLLCFRNQGQFPFVNIPGGDYPMPPHIVPVGHLNFFMNGAGCDLKVENTLLNNTPIVLKPNPSNGIFTIVVPANAERYCAVTVSNMMGQIVQQMNVPCGQETQVHIDVPDGVYVLSMNIGNNCYKERIQVQR